MATEPPNTQLIHFDAARRALALASSIDEVKEIRDKAEALRQYIQQQGASLEMQNQCAEIKLRAERRAGELLGEMEKNPGGNPNWSHDATSLPPKLKDLGVSKHQSHRWQAVAAVPEETFEQHVAAVKARDGELTSIGLYRLAKEMARDGRRKEYILAAEGDAPLDGVSLYTASLIELADLVSSESIDWILTDPPYGQEWLPNFNDLGLLATRVLKPGGSLAVMAGQSYLPQVLSLLAHHLRYHWTLAYLTPGGQAPQMWQCMINTFWKPVVWFTKGEYQGKWVGDVARSPVNDKRFHDWGQSEGGMADLVERLTEPGQMILDPCVGGGSTGVAALALGRGFIGADSDPEAVATTRGRLTAGG